jgi:glyoxylase-like metal-dependent hydrolase (beta-lactamase superfamily II)
VSNWIEVGRDVFALRYRFFDQQIGVVAGADAVLVVDTRTSHRQADEIRRDVGQLTRRPIAVVVNTHGHSDHAFGNRVFRPAPIWGHARCVEMLRATGEPQRQRLIAGLPDMADELREIVIDPPDRTFEQHADVEVGGRSVELRYLGRGHTDNDIVVSVPDAGVVFAGDLVENGAVPYFGDGYPIDWPGTAGRLLELVSGPVVPGHGDVADRAFVERQLEDFRAVAALAGRIHAGELRLDDALNAAPFPADAAREPLERAIRQLRGELG